MYGDWKTDVRARFSADPDSTFKSRSDSLDRDSMRTGLAAAFSLSERSTLKLKYQGEDGAKVRSHGGEAVLMFEF